MAQFEDILRKASFSAQDGKAIELEECFAEVEQVSEDVISDFQSAIENSKSKSFSMNAQFPQMHWYNKTDVVLHALQDNKNVEELTLDINLFGHEASITALSELLKHNTTLKSLILKNNNHYGFPELAPVNKLFDAFSNNSTIEKIDLSDNSLFMLSRNMLNKLSMAFQNNISLTDINLSDNNLNETFTQEVKEVTRRNQNIIKILDSISHGEQHYLEAEDRLDASIVSRPPALKVLENSIKLIKKNINELSTMFIGKNMPIKIDRIIQDANLFMDEHPGTLQEAELTIVREYVDLGSKQRGDAKAEERCKKLNTILKEKSYLALAKNIYHSIKPSHPFYGELMVTIAYLRTTKTPRWETHNGKIQRIIKATAYVKKASVYGLEADVDIAKNYLIIIDKEWNSKDWGEPSLKNLAKHYGKELSEAMIAVDEYAKTYFVRTSWTDMGKNMYVFLSTNPFVRKGEEEEAKLSESKKNIP